MATEVVETKIKLTHLECGDQNNNAWYNTYESHPEDAVNVLDMVLRAGNGMDEVESIIFAGDITADGYRKILKILTLYEAYGVYARNPEATAKKANILFFATLVNYNGTVSKAINKIKSFQAARDAVETASENGSLDYREFIISGNNTNWDRDYKTIVLDAKNYSSKLNIKIPIVRLPLGFWRFASDRIPAVLEIVDNRVEGTPIVVSYTTWMNIIKDAMNGRRRTKFSKFDEKSLGKLIKLENDTVDEILAQNNYGSIFHFVNAYDMYVEPGKNQLMVCNTKIAKLGSDLDEWSDDKRLSELDDVPMNLNWIPAGEGKYLLWSKEFYLAKLTGSTIHILQPR